MVLVELCGIMYIGITLMENKKEQYIKLVNDRFNNKTKIFY